MENSTQTNYDPEEKIWFGSKRKDLFGPDITIGEAILFILNRNPEKVIQIMDTTGEEMTAAQLIRESKLIAKNFMEMGIEAGDVIGIYASNSQHLAAVNVAAFLCGTPWNALYPGFDKENIKLIYKVTRPKIIFCDVENYEIMKTAIEDLELEAKLITLNGVIKGAPSIEDLLKDDGAEDLEYMRFPCHDLNGDDTAVIICSSGTTGNPKGVLCSHRTLMNITIFLTLNSNSVVFSFSTLYWISALWTLLASILNGVKRIITNRPSSPEYFQYLVEKHRITHVLSAKHDMLMLFQAADERTPKRLESLDTIMCGGAKVPNFLAENFHTILKANGERNVFTVAYGMSELGGLLSQYSGALGVKSSEGKLLPNMAVRIIDVDSNKALGPNITGNIFIRLPYKWLGYFQNEEATRKVYDGLWLNTGDVGYFNNGDNGCLHICARNSDVFKSYGFQIFPDQLESIMGKLLGISEVCVFPIPDLVAENLVASAVVKTKDEVGKNLSEEDVIEHVKENTVDIYHLKGGVYFLNELPKTSSGKLLRKNVYDIVKDMKRKF